MLPLWAVVVVAAAAYRVAVLVAHDALFYEVRDAVQAWAWVVDPDSPATDPKLKARGGAWRCYVYALVTCPSCLAVWFATGGWALWRYGGDAGRAFVTVWAVAGVASFALALGRDD